MEKNILGFNMKKFILASILCISITGITHALNLGEIRTEVRLHIKDSNTSRQNYTDAQLNSMINQAHRDVCNISWVIKKSDDFELSVNTTHYALPTDLIQITRVTFRDEALTEKSIAGLDGEFEESDWETSSGYPEDYYQNPVLPGYISFYPWPATSSSTGTVKVQYIAKANTLSSDSDTPFNGDDRFQDYSDILIWYPVYEIYAIEGRTDKAQYYLNAYESRLTFMMDKLGQRPNFMPSFGGQRK
jgi:hypothetical protein